MDPREFAAEARTEIRQRTAGVNKGHEQRLTFKIGQANFLPVLVGQFHIRRGTAGRKWMDYRSGFWSLSAAGVGYSKVVQPVILPVISDEVGGDLVTGFHNRRHQWRSNLERHRHRRHESRYFLVLQRDLTGRGIFLDYFA